MHTTRAGAGRDEDQMAVNQAPPVAAPQGAAGSTATERERILTMLAGLVEPLGSALPMSSELVLHDLGALPDSIVAVHGDVTGRRPGDPATDVLLEQAGTGDFRNMVGYRTRLMDGRAMRSTTAIVRDSAGNAVAALCINSDVSVWESLERIAGAMVGRAGVTSGDVGPGGTGAGGAVAGGTVPGISDDGTSADTDGPVDDGADEGGGEVFARDVDELASHLVHRAIRDQGIPVELMRKEHKLAVVRDLKGRGMFLLRDAVEMIATSLQVTRFTIYNYLNEIGEESTTPRRQRRTRSEERDTE